MSNRKNANGHWGASQVQARAEILTALLDKSPDAAARTLARKLHSDHPLLFPSLENARAAVRGRFGQRGSRTGIATHLRPARKPGEMPPLPECKSEPWTPFILDAKRNLCLSDVHLPYHSLEALKLALKYGDKFKPDCIFINGDLYDFYQLSRFDKSPTKEKVLGELQAGRQFFEHLRARFRKSRIIYKWGNHDERWDLYMQRNCPHLCDIPSVRDAWYIESGIAANGVEVVKDQRPVMCGKLPVLHGHELGKGISSPVNPARGAFLRAHHTILVGHSHQTSGHADTNIWHSETQCWSTGCLCELTPEYARVNRWNNGFATIEVYNDGAFDVQNMRIANGEVRKS